MIATLLAVALQADVAPPPPPVPIAPTSGWRLSTLGSCTISRDFDRLGDPITVGLRLWPASQHAQIILVRKTGATHLILAAKVMVTLGQGPATSTNWGYYWVKGSRVLTIAATRSDLTVLEPAPALTIAVDGESQVVVTLDGAKAALAQLDGCKRGADDAYGVPAGEQATLKTRAKLISSGITSDDYPASALREEASGTSYVVVRITAEGKIDDCKLLLTSGDDRLDAATCRLILRRTRYAPATDQNGKPVVSHALQPLYWDLPD